MRAVIMAALMASMGATAVHAACYQRTYTAEHLAKNPDQTVRKLRIALPESIEGPGAAWAWFRDSGKEYSMPLWCFAPPAGSPKGARTCGVECDGGTFLLKPRDAKSVLLTTTFGFLVSGGCGAEDEDTRWIKDEGKPSTTFRLNTVAASVCPK